MLAAGMVLTIMVLPLIIAVSREVMLTVPTSQREAMLALGATRWEVIRYAVLPSPRWHSGWISGTGTRARQDDGGDNGDWKPGLANQLEPVPDGLYAFQCDRQPFGEATPGIFFQL